MTMRMSKGKKIGAAVSGLVLVGAGTVVGSGAAFADEPPSDDAVIKACGGDFSELPSGTVVECSYEVKNVNRELTAVSGIRGNTVGNCSQDAIDRNLKAKINGGGTYTLSTEWKIGSFELTFFGKQIIGGEIYAKGEELRKEAGASYDIDPGFQAQLLVAQFYDSTNGTYHVTVKSVDPDGNIYTDSERHIDRTDVQIPKDKAPAIDVEQVRCGEEFRIPKGDAGFFPKDAA
jgi:hypothetical protein